MRAGKALIAVLLVTLLAVLTLPSASTAASQPNGKCTKIGATTSIKSKIYKCTKVKGKLIWQVAPTKPIPLATPTPSSTPTPTPIPSDPYGAQGNYAWIYRSLDAFAAKWFQSAPSKAPSYLIEIEGAPDKARTSMMMGAELSGRLLSTLRSDIPPQNIFIYDTADWLQKRLSPLCPQIMNSIKLAPGNAGCGRVFVLDGPAMQVLTEDRWISDSAHELFHNVQTQAAVAVKPSWDGQAIPSWFREGSANVVSRLTYAIYLNGQAPSYRASYPTAIPSQTQCGAAFSYWRTSDDPSGHDKTNWCEYDIGNIMLELLIGKAGSLDSVLNVYSDVAGGTPFRSSFEKRFGWSFETYYIELEKLLVEVGWKF